ncbi:hypothetical protein [Veillonella sp. R32]|uniref:hypothetical protein n=1 Tax=Veillonella sp. R32 TaxID=2021312 RepID=UPI001389E446|nr:hypothetical protein [Veillonella sp. R32]KAF1683070.1 hypothetical protein VER_02955 [Veillonella sp. R32]
MASLQRALLVVAFLYILYHIYSYGVTTTNMIAIVLLVLSFFLEVTRKSRRAKLEAYFARKEAELAAKEAAEAGVATKGQEDTVQVTHEGHTAQGTMNNQHKAVSK